MGRESGILPAEIAGQEAKFLAVFRNGPAGDVDALALEPGHQFLVAQRVRPVLPGDEIVDHLLHAGVGHRVAAVRLIAGREEIFEIEHPVRGLDVLVRDGAADGRLVHADGVGDLRHRQRLQAGDPVLEELLLHLDDLPGDALDRLLALLDRVDEETPRPHAFAQIVPFVLGQLALGDEFPVGLADAEARNVVVVEVDPHLSSSFSTVTSGTTTRLLSSAKRRPGRRIQGADLLDGRLDLLDGRAQPAGQVGNAAAGEQLEMVRMDEKPTIKRADKVKIMLVPVLTL